MLSIKDLKVKIEDKEILNGINLEIGSGEVHVVMGPNGSGKSTLAKVLMGHPSYEIQSGTLLFNGEDITEAAPEDRAQHGMFMAFQYPKEIAGVQLDRFLFQAYSNIMKAQDKDPGTVFDFSERLKKEAEELKMNPELIQRSLNQGFSGGEKKKAEMLQLSILQPQLALLDETDSGLDVDALRIVGEAIKRFKSKEKSILIVTHYNRILEYVEPDYTHLMINGVITKSGGGDFAHELEKNGYEQFVK